MTIDDISLVPRRVDETNTRIEIVCDHPSLQSAIGSRVTIFYELRAKLHKVGHLYYATIKNPTHNVSMEFEFSQADVEYVNVVDFFVSARSPSIRYIPTPEDFYKIEVELGEWVFPKGGAVFIWELRERKISCVSILSQPLRHRFHH